MTYLKGMLKVKPATTQVKMMMLMRMERTMEIGMDLTGLRHSAPVVARPSKPINA